MELCERLQGEIVSVDSVQVFRGLDIGSAKPTEDEQRRVRHHVLDVVEPTESMDAARWVAEAQTAIDEIRGRGRRPILVGGTGMYLRSLVWGLAEVPPIPDQVRSAVRASMEELGPEESHRRLALVDPAAAERIAPQDGQRIGRALEVHEATGKALSVWQEEARAAGPRLEAVVVALLGDREALYGRINQRARIMLGAGWLDEVEGLLAAGVAPDAPGLMALGYRDVVGALAGRTPLSDLPKTVSQAHRRYARRQLTWFRGMERRQELVAIDPGRENLVSQVVSLAEPCG